MYVHIHLSSHLSIGGIPWDTEATPARGAHGAAPAKRARLWGANKHECMYIYIYIYMYIFIYI